jgi:hypothetical protein
LREELTHEQHELGMVGRCYLSRGDLVPKWLDGGPRERDAPPMPRQARLDAPGTLHHVMVRGIERTQIVRDDADRAACLACVVPLAVVGTWF